ncbi:DUF1203 domain-containing protein [Roseateles toxinivorans]|uniref:Uncharacterized protein DUF1203 n=1 Tax=Roseateles toxinivorans TaxID=270368 RepID=A0A4R6QP74_9BURK|nr:DUF1203 domain-containing protein [Roseateles toxinivorans]TDP72660.1 uncharacterized protein DUF1203 [Roseateles toxinivorans]
MYSYQLTGLDHRLFEPLFELPDEALARIGAQRRTATEADAYPCRISLEDAALGDELLLLPFEHQPADSPYRASGPIFVRRGVKQRTMVVAEAPSYVGKRLISVRAYDAAHMIVDAAVCEGTQVGTEIERCFANQAVAYIHLHNAKRGCFSCRVDRKG